MSAVSPRTTGHLTTASSPHWPVQPVIVGQSLLMAHVKTLLDVVSVNPTTPERTVAPVPADSLTSLSATPFPHTQPTTTMERPNQLERLSIVSAVRLGQWITRADLIPEPGLVFVKQGSLETTVIHVPRASMDSTVKPVSARVPVVSMGHVTL